MKILLKLEIQADDGTPVAQGEIVDSLEPLKTMAGQPILSVRMRNILQAVKDTISHDSVRSV